MTVQTIRQVEVGKRIRLSGNVQGSGIRPDVARLATRCAVSGYVRNSNQGVEIAVRGWAEQVQQFCDLLAAQLPCANLSIADTGVERLSPSEFQILESDVTTLPSFELPLDRVVCAACLEEAITPGNRRYAYALNSCAKCGPRYSIMQATPYDRQHTSMAQFPMCGLCRAEYADPNHRRFHAQTNCCPRCGPQIWFEALPTREKRTDHPISLAAQAVIDGRILAIKGLGGYQLVCDATRQECVGRLRDRKGRASKPVAIMVQSVEAARHLAVIDELEEQALRSPAGPIVVVRARRDTNLAENIHSGLEDVGLMLPTTAMHAMLLQSIARPVVVTSANHEGDPIEYRDENAVGSLSEIADCFLHHNRPIVRPLDDSVVRCMAGNVATLRAARGLAPMPIGDATDFILAVGGQQKNAVAVSNGQIAFLSPHVGDLGGLPTRDRFNKQVPELGRLLQTRPSLIASDMHPDYFNGVWASEQQNCDQLRLQHHHAHVAAGMLERGWLNQTVLGFAFDGTGYGADGTIWGGEVLLASATEFSRVAHLKHFRLPGGDAVVRQPWRVAVSLLQATSGDQLQAFATRFNLDADIVQAVAKLSISPMSPATSSMGRLFDAVSALVAGQTHCSFEGEAAMRLEALCAVANSLAGRYALELSDSTPIELDWRPVIRSILADIMAGDPDSAIAMRFHHCVADGIATVAGRFPDYPVVLSGGVFQNRVLVELVAAKLKDHPAPVALPGRIPVNDGGLAAGQLAIATRRRKGNIECV